MRLTDFRLEQIGGRMRSSAAMTWEDCGRHDATVYFDVDVERGRDASCNPHAFLLACAIPAMYYGERRVYLDATLSPVLLEGLSTALSILRVWHHPERTEPLSVEAKALRSGLPERSVERAGFFFSGGIDSYATLRLNMLTYPDGHPYRIREGVLAFGLEQDDPEKFDHLRRYLSQAAEASGIELTTVFTNAYLLHRDEDARNAYRFWKYHYQGSALASIAHSLRHRLSAMSISATLSPRTLAPYGSHPMLDPCYSSHDMRIAHTGGGLTRLEKTRLVAEWGTPLSHLRVCNQSRTYEAGIVNCGVCSKCIKTKLALSVLGRLHDCRAFASDEVSADLVRQRVRVNDGYDVEVVEELAPPLRRTGHDAIARVLEEKVERYRGRNGVAARPTLPMRAARRLRRWIAERRSN